MSLPDTINIHYDFTFYQEENILRKLSYVSTFEEMSKWVVIYSDGQKYIANPSIATDTDRLDCLFAVQNPLVLALKPIKKRRKNGRDKRLIEAANASDYAKIAEILASAAGSYWRDHGFLTSFNRKNIIPGIK